MLFSLFVLSGEFEARTFSLLDIVERNTGLQRFFKYSGLCYFGLLRENKTDPRSLVDPHDSYLVSFKASLGVFKVGLISYREDS